MTELEELQARLDIEKMRQKNVKKERINTWEQLEETPFHVITSEGQEGKEYRLSIGLDLMTERVFTAKEDIEHYINKKPMELLMNMMAYITKDVIRKINNGEIKL